jgi:hypothetical protein
MHHIGTWCGILTIFFLPPGARTEVRSTWYVVAVVDTALFAVVRMCFVDQTFHSATSLKES